MEDKLFVSVVIITYNQEAYIEKAIKSVLKQNIDFKYELIIGDDCSEDKTVNILKHYKERYPNIIKLVLRNKNVGPTKNFYDLLGKAKGKYIAQLEGDDYWIDKNKLKIQTTFLEKNQNYIGTAHSCKTYNQQTHKYEEKGTSYWYKKDKEFTFRTFLKKQFPGHTGTMVYRNFIKNSDKDYSIIYKADRNTGDRTIVLLLVGQGDIFCFGKTMSVYRKIRNVKEENINSQYLKKNMMERQFKYLLNINKYSKKEFSMACISQNTIDTYIANALLYYIKNKTKENYDVFSRLLSYGQKSYMIYFLMAKLLNLKQVLKKVIS